MTSSDPYPELRGRTAIITGAAGGIGLATARWLAERGMAIVGLDLPGSALDEVAALRDLGVKATMIEGDVCSATDWETVVGAALKSNGRIDLLFNNAAIPGPIESIMDYDIDAFDRVMRINVTGAALGIKHCAAHMRARGGSIVNVSSISGLGGGSGRMLAYNTSKHAIIGVTRVAAQELAQYKIRVNAICPSPTDAGMISVAEDRIAPDDREAARLVLSAGNPMKRYARTEEIAATVGFLASDSSSFISGVALPIDGGLTAR